MLSIDLRCLQYFTKAFIAEANTAEYDAAEYKVAMGSLNNSSVFYLFPLILECLIC